METNIEDKSDRLLEVGSRFITKNENIELPIISKTQARKLRNRQKWLAKLPERRRQEKLRKKAKKLAKKESYSIEKLTSDKICASINVDHRPNKKRHNLMKDSDNKFTIVIDLDFNEYMEPPEFNKLAKQVGRIYAINRKADRPCQLYLTSLHGKVKDHMNKSQPGYINWDIHKSENNYLDLFTNSNKTYQPNDDKYNHIVYMSGDSENTLPDVDEIINGNIKIFIIGGLVDHNRHKGLCHKRAIESGVSTAKLPINSYVKLNQRHILSTLTVFEILLLITGSPGISWEEALIQAIPKRKLDPNKSNPK